MCQHEERGPHAQLISAISPNALCVSFVGSAFVTQRESEAGREEEGCRKRAQEEKCYSNSNCPCSLFAFVWGRSAMIRWSLLHFIARPPLSPHTLYPAPAYCQVCSVCVLTDFAVDAYRKWALFLSLSLSSIFFFSPSQSVWIISPCWEGVQDVTLCIRYWAPALNYFLLVKRYLAAEYYLRFYFWSVCSAQLVCRGSF